MLNQILSGIGGGLVIGLTGFGKSKGEELDLKKMGITLLTSAIIGAIAGALNMDYGILANGTMAAGLTMIIENTIKTVSRRLK